MGRLLAQLDEEIDLFVSSDASRARETAEIAAEAAGYEGEIELEPEIYGADVDDLLGIVQRLPNEARCVVIVGHNPGFEELSAALATAGTPPPTLPTAGLAHLRFEANRWRDVREGTGELVAVYTPKGLGGG
jgi:phosphohistidine phosphatase